VAEPRAYRDSHPPHPDDADDRGHDPQANRSMRNSPMNFAPAGGLIWRTAQRRQT
jgi:hypothetical protein